MVKNACVGVCVREGGKGIREFKGPVELTLYVTVSPYCVSSRWTIRETCLSRESNSCTTQVTLHTFKCTHTCIHMHACTHTHLMKTVSLPCFPQSSG